MKKISRILLAGLLMAGVGGLSPLTVSQAHAELPSVRKIAVVDINRILNETSAGKRARKKLEDSFGKKQKKLEKRQKKLESDQAKLAQMAPEQQRAAAEKLQREYMEFQNMYMTMNQEISQQEAELTKEIYKKSSAIVAKLAKSMGIDLVLVGGQATVVYSQKGIDVTDKVIQKYNQKYK